MKRKTQKRLLAATKQYLFSVIEILEDEGPQYEPLAMAYCKRIENDMQVLTNALKTKKQKR